MEPDVVNSEVKKVRHLKGSNDTDYTRFSTRVVTKNSRWWTQI